MTSQSPTVGTKLAAPSIGTTVIIATFALNLLALALPLVVLQIFDRVIPFSATETLFFLFVGLCLVAVLEFVLKTARTVLLGHTGKAFEIELSKQFMAATLNASPEKFSQTTPATHLDQFGAIAQLRGFYAGQGRILAIDLPFTVVFVVMIALIGGWLVLVPLGCVLALLLFRASLQVAQSSIFEKRRQLDSRRYSFLAEALSQIETLKANTMEAQLLRRYELLQEQTTEISHRIIKFSGISQSFGALFSQLAVAAMGLFGSYLVVTKQIGIAELAACMLLNGRTVQPMLKALGLWVQSENISAGKTKFQKACAIEQMPAAPDLTSELVGSVHFQSVSQASDDKKDPLFENLNLSVAPGSCVHVSGENSAAKTSFLKLILGEVSARKGSVLIDRRPARDFLGSKGEFGIAYVDHKPVMFAGTVLENISAFGDGDRIKLALDLSLRLGLEKYVQRLPLGYNTQVLGSPTLKSNRAALQCMSLVRALALQPKILLINNIGAGLDNTARSTFKDIMTEQKGKTTLVMAENSKYFNGLADLIYDFYQNKDPLIDAWTTDAQADQKSIVENPSKRQANAA